MESRTIAKAAARAASVSGGSTLAFAGVFAAALLCFLAIGCVLPVLPRYVHGPLGGGDVAVGIVTGAFAFTAVVGRPVAGRLADARGRRAVMLIGAGATALAGLLYFVPAGVGGLIGARLILGVGEGFVFTAGATWVVDLAPAEQRGRGIGLFGLAIWLALALGPLLGEGLLAAGGYDAVWAFAAASPLAGALVLARVADRSPPDQPQQRAPLLAPGAWRPGIALALANVGYAALAGFIVLDLRAHGSTHGSAVFTAFAIAVVSTRLALGHLPDRIGPRRSAMAAGCAETLGLAAIALATSLPLAIVGGVVMGMGFSTMFPALALVAVDGVPENRRGSALGSFTAFFDAGVGVGAPAAGAIAALGSYGWAFWFASACAAASVAVIGASAVHHRRAAGSTA